MKELKMNKLELIEIKKKYNKKVRNKQRFISYKLKDLKLSTIDSQLKKMMIKIGDNNTELMPEIPWTSIIHSFEVNGKIIAIEEEFGGFSGVSTFKLKTILKI